MTDVQALAETVRASLLAAHESTYTPMSTRRMNHVQALAALDQLVLEHTRQEEALKELREKAQLGADRWREQQDEDGGKGIVDACGVRGPSIISLNARRQSFEWFVKEIDAALSPPPVASGENEE